MKVISEISLKDFKFWEGAKDTANELTDEQFDMVEQAIEELHPDGIEDVELNDIFRFDRDWVFETAGVWPKYFKVIAECGLAEYVKVSDTDDMDTLESAGVDFEEVSAYEADELADLDSDELKDFYHTHFFNVTSKVKHTKMVIRCNGEDEVEDFKGVFKYATIEEITKVPDDGIENAEDWFDWDDCTSDLAKEFVYDEGEMYDKYNIPAWAVNQICKLILDPHNESDYYDVPESEALNMAYTGELTDDENKSIESFVKGLNKAMPNGFIIDWDDESCGSPYFDTKPKFGSGSECVTLRVYEK